MALVTIQRSPSPSTEDDLDTAGSSEDAIDGKSAIKRRSKSTKEKLKKIIRSVHFITKLRPCLSDSYFTVKGAALILPNNEYSKKTSRKSHGGEIQEHLQAMLHLLRPEDKIKIAVRLEDLSRSKFSRYMALVSTLGRQDTEEAVILGIDCCKGETACIRLVLPVWLGVKLRLGGDGGFTLCTDQQAYLFNPVSVQAMWSAIQSVARVIHVAEDRKYLQHGLSHTWVDYYRAQMNQDLNRNSHWNVEGVEIFAPSCLSLENDEDESTKHAISVTLRDVMMNVDLDEATSRSLRMAVEEKLGISLKLFRSYFDEEVMRILGQMDAPSKILDYLYLGSEWNASNLDELKEIGIGYILNITQEIDNFFSGMFHYFNVRLYDLEDSDLLKHWDKTFKFISKARDHGSKVFVHCKMGISRSASSVMAYLMKLNRWSVEEAHAFVKARRSCVRPNNGFMEQLHMYEAILSASNKREIFRVKSDPNLSEDRASDEGEQCQGYLLGDSLFHVLSTPDWSAQGSQTFDKEEEWLRTHEHMEPGIVEMETDLETMDSRSGDSIEETHPDIPSPPPSHSASQARTSTSSASPQMALEPQFSLDSLVSDGGSHPPLCNVPRIKPDSSWIKITVTSDEMNEEADGQSQEQQTRSLEEGPAEDEQGQSTIPPLSATEIAHGVPCNPLSPPDGNMQLGECSSEYKTEDFSPPPPLAPSACKRNVQRSNFSRSFPPLSSFSHEHESMIADQTEFDAPASVSAPCVLADVSQPVASTQGMIMAFDQNENPMAGVNESHGMTMTTTTTAQSLPHSVPSSSSNEGTSSEGSLLSRGRVEVGVREYFYREKIPWNPGKVQKIREGINRTGHLVSSREDGTSQSGNIGEPMTVDSNDNVDMTSTSKEGDTQQQTSSNDEMDCQSYTASPEESSHVEGGSQSLYDKEEIPLEPGTVQRTRMEIEERARSWCESDTSQSKPVIRTSSLKHVKDASPPHSEKAKRRVSCGPIIEQVSAARSEEGIYFFGKEPLDLRAEGMGDREHASVLAAPEDVVKCKGEIEGQQSQTAVSLQAFGDDVTIQQGLVKKHKREIETKRDSPQKVTSAPAHADHSGTHLTSKHHMPPVRETSTDDDSDIIREGSTPTSSHESSSAASSGRQTQTCQPIESSQTKVFTVGASVRESTNVKGRPDEGATELVRANSADCVTRSPHPHPHSEQAIDEEMSEGDESKGDGASQSNLVQFFVKKIEKQSEGDLKSPRQIEFVESSGERDEMTVLLTTAVSEDVQFSQTKSGTKIIDLGFDPGESVTEEDLSPVSTSKSQQPLGSNPEACEPPVVRHLVGRFEFRRPDDDCSGDVCREFSRHDSGNLMIHELEPKTSSSAPGVYGGEEVGKSVHPSSASHHHSSSLPASLASSSTSAFTPKLAAAFRQNTPPEAVFIPISSADASAHPSQGSAWRKQPVMPAFPVQRGDKETHYLGPPTQRPRPKSADHVHYTTTTTNINTTAEGSPQERSSDSRAYTFPESSMPRRFSGNFPVAEGQLQSDLSSRQCPEDSRKVRKLHGKSHPLTRLASQQQQQQQQHQQQQHQRGGPFHSSM